MSECKYEQFDEKTCRITNPKFIPIDGRIKVKLEGPAFGASGIWVLRVFVILIPFKISTRVIDWGSQVANVIRTINTN